MQCRKFLVVSFISLCVFAGLTTPVWAIPTIEFRVGHWAYNVDTSTLAIDNAWVAVVNGDIIDPLCDYADVVFPEMTIGGDSINGYTLSGGTIELIQWDDPSVKYMIGALGVGDLIPDGNDFMAYTSFQTDIFVNSVNNSIGSDALDEIETAGRLDFNLDIIGFAAELDQLDFQTALQKGKKGVYEYYASKKKIVYKDDKEGKMPIVGVGNGSMTTIIPAPGALILSSIGLIFGSAGANLSKRLRRRKKD